MTDVSVIVLDAGGGDMLRDCLGAIHAQTVKPLEVIVHDNSRKNIGFAAGVNAAYAKARGDAIALVNNDAVLDADWLETVTRALDDDPKLAAVQTIIRRDEATIDGAGIDISDGTFRQIAHGLPSQQVAELPGEHPGNGHGLPSYRVAELPDKHPGAGHGLSQQVAELPGEHPGNPATRQPGNPAWGVSATATLYRRAAIGDRFFDPRFFAYYEDVELCARLHESGWTTRVLPLIKATHRGSASASILGRDAIRLRTRNRYWVARRHRGVGRIGALLIEDLKELVRSPSIARLRGVWEGLRT